MTSNNIKVSDGQNISLADAICRCGFKRLDDQQFELTDGNKKFVLSNLVGVVKEIPVLEENIQTAGSANGEQEIKHQKQIKKKEGNDEDDNIQLAADPLKKHNLDEENSKQTKALEQNGFHIIGEDGYQSGTTGKNNNNNVNKDSSTSPSIVRGGRGEADGSHLESEKDKEERHKKANKKSF